MTQLVVTKMTKEVTLNSHLMCFLISCMVHTYLSVKVICGVILHFSMIDTDQLSVASVVFKDMEKFMPPSTTMSTQTVGDMR